MQIEYNQAFPYAFLVLFYFFIYLINSFGHIIFQSVNIFGNVCYYNNIISPNHIKAYIMEETESIYI